MEIRSTLPDEQSMLFNPWIEIWIRPRGTIRRIVDTNPKRSVLWLAVLSGVAGFPAFPFSFFQIGGELTILLLAATQSPVLGVDQISPPLILLLAGILLWRIPHPLILLLAAALVPVFGVLGLYIGGWWYRWIGSWFGGKATSEQVRAAIAWSQVPNISSLVLWIPAVAIFLATLFSAQTPLIEANPFLALGFLLFRPALIGLQIWKSFVWIKCLAEVHRFSAWRSLGAIVLSLLAAIIAVAVAAGLWPLAVRAISRLLVFS